jgi:hypothetical protein
LLLLVARNACKHLLLLLVGLTWYWLLRRGWLYDSL